jgi:hypothetical protein
MPEYHGRRRSRRLTTAGLIAISAATLLMMAWVIFPTAAFADGTHVWGVDDQKQGSIKLPCPNGGHWNFQFTGTITSATLHVGSEVIPMSLQGNHFDADSSGPVDASTSVFVTWIGPGDGSFLTLSHCLEGPPPTTSSTTATTSSTTATTSSTTATTSSTTATTSSTTATTTSPGSSTTTPGGTTTTPTTTTESPTVGPTTVQPSETDTVAPTTVTPGGTAFTGIENVVPIGALALLLMTSGSGLLWAGARRRGDDVEDED